MKRGIQTLRFFLLMLLILGVVYPLIVWSLSHLFWPRRSEGSLIFNADHQVIGSHLLGQKFEGPGFFWGRPSEGHYSASPSGGSNWGPTSQHLKDQIEARMKSLKEAHPKSETTRIPPDLLFGSASGLDPHISPDAARYQLMRVSKARHLTEKQSYDLGKKIDELVEEPDFMILGDDRVNVLELNLALEAISKLNY